MSDKRNKQSPGAVEWQKRHAYIAIDLLTKRVDSERMAAETAIRAVELRSSLFEAGIFICGVITGLGAAVSTMRAFESLNMFDLSLSGIASFALTMVAEECIRRLANANAIEKSDSIRDKSEKKIGNIQAEISRLRLGKATPTLHDVKKVTRQTELARLKEFETEIANSKPGSREQQADVLLHKFLSRKPPGSSDPGRPSGQSLNNGPGL